MSEIHPFDPIYEENSKILILGSFPSVKSRDVNFYYGHAQNRFWKLLAYIFNQKESKSIKEKKELLLNNNLALWDIVKECDIDGSSDISIRNIIINDIDSILDKSNIKKICFNGKIAYRIFHKYYKGEQKFDISILPSTSPANAVYTLEKLAKKWKEEICN